jgi:ElaB/YqjD/DUF883 family membrane-anchored ribosome-binding protein
MKVANATEKSRTANEVQEEIEQTRADLDSTLAEIGKRLSPHEMKERAVDYAKDTASAVSDAVQRNETALMLVGAIAAAVLLARYRLHLRREHERAEYVRAVWDRICAALPESHEPQRLSATITDVADRIGELTHEARLGVSQTVGDAAAGAQRLLHTDAAARLIEPTKRVAASIEDSSREHPLMTLAIAALAGTLFGTTLRR